MMQPTSYAVTECVLHINRNICHLISILSQAGDTRPCTVPGRYEGRKTVHIISGKHFDMLLD